MLVIDIFYSLNLHSGEVSSKCQPYLYHRSDLRVEWSYNYMVQTAENNFLRLKKAKLTFQKICNEPETILNRNTK